MENSMEVSQKLKTELPYDPASSCLCWCSKERKTGSWRSIFPPIFTAALFTIGNIQKQKEDEQIDSTDELKKIWHTHIYTHTHTYIYYSAMRKKEILPFATKWMDPEGTILNGKKGREKQILHNITYMWNLKKPNSQKQRVEWFLPRAWEVGEKWGKCWSKAQTSSYKMNKFWGSNVQHGDYS